MVRLTPSMRGGVAENRGLWLAWLAGIACVVLGADLATKHWVQQNIPLGQHLAWWPEVCQLTHTRNTGMAFSLLHHAPELVRWGSAALWVLLVGWVVLQPKGSPLRTGVGMVAAGLIMGGALANGWERFTHGWVTDFIDVVAVHFAIFNVADTAVCVGVALWCVLLFKHNLSAANATPKVA